MKSPVRRESCLRDSVHVAEMMMVVLQANSLEVVVVEDLWEAEEEVEADLAVDQDLVEEEEEEDSALEEGAMEEVEVSAEAMEDTAVAVIEL